MGAFKNEEKQSEGEREAKERVSNCGALSTEKSNILISTEVSFNLELIRSFSLYDYH